MDLSYIMMILFSVLNNFVPGLPEKDKEMEEIAQAKDKYQYLFSIQYEIQNDIYMIRNLLKS